MLTKALEEAADPLGSYLEAVRRCFDYVTRAVLIPCCHGLSSRKKVSV